MRFSAIAVSAAIFGVAMAVPTVVYETEVVTITSCAPEKTNCPGRAHSSTTLSAVAASSTYTPPAYTPPVIPTTSSIPVPSSSYISYPNGTAPVSYSHSAAYTPSIVSAVASNVAPTTYAWTPSASAGIPYAPANTSTPATPSTPPPFEGAASIKGFSFAAAVMAAAAFVLA